MELYVHIPFCRQKCRYCSFTSFTGQEAYFQEYTELLLREALIRKADVSEPLKTVYIGGGTPSLLPPSVFSGLVTGLGQIFDLNTVTEFTTEANPGTVTKEWMDTAAALGINRISFGMQAYQDSILHLLGRIHQFEDVVSAVSLARNAGINNISIDLIFGIPTQTIGDWERTADAALSLEPVHISAYGLIPEPGTPLCRDLESGRLTLPDPEEERRMYDLIISKTSACGFHQYEISSFALDSFECRHNIGYWTQVPYLGLGVSAASMTDTVYREDGMYYDRSVNPDTPDAYENMVRSGKTSDRERIRPADARFETMMLGLRMNRGISETDFMSRHRISIEQCYGKKLKELEKLGLVIHENNTWRLSSRGFDIQNSVLVELMDG